MTGPKGQMYRFYVFMTPLHYDPEMNPAVNKSYSGGLHKVNANAALPICLWILSGQVDVSWVPKG